MWLIILFLILILAIALIQVNQGIYGATIMAFISTVCAITAFAFYEKLGELFLYNMQRPYADGVALLALFVIPMIVLREVADRFLGKDIPLGMWTNRIGGGVLGLYTGMICVGILAVSMQMMPFNAAIFGYKPFNDSLERGDSLAPFYPDRFVTGMFSKFSSLGLAGERSFDQAHDDLILELFCARNTAEKFGRNYCEPPKKGKETANITVHETFEPTPAQWNRIEKSDEMPNYPLLDDGQSVRKIIVKADITNKARDEDNYLRLPATHFRLVTVGGKSYYPIGFLKRPAVVKGKYTAIWAEKNEDDEVDLVHLALVPNERITEDKFEVFLVYAIADNSDQAEAMLGDDDSKKVRVEGNPDYILFRKLGMSRIGKITKSLPRALPPKKKAETDKKKRRNKKRRG